MSNRDLPEVRRLLAKGGDPNMLCPDSFVRLHASEKFRAGQAQNTGRSLLHHAAWAGDLSIFQRLVEAGADVMRQRNTAWRPNGGVRGRGATPLHHAVMYNRKKIVDFMLNTLGVPVDLPGEQGCTGVVNVPSWQRRSLLPRPPGTRGLGAWASGLGCSTPPRAAPQRPRPEWQREVAPPAGAKVAQSCATGRPGTRRSISRPSSTTQRW